MQISNLPFINSCYNYFNLKNFLDYQPKLQLHFETPQFEVKTANNFQELYSAFFLRGKVFKNTFLNVDFDHYDLFFDHLILKDKKKNKIIGTYRLNSTQFSTNFYSTSEFDLSCFMELPGNKLELGRACIHHKYRNGKTIDLLWKGIFQYAKKTNTKYIFGCTSIKSTQIEYLCKISSFFENKNILDNSYNVVPRNNFSFDRFFQEYKDKNLPITNADVPSLLKTYLFSGAKVCGHPYFDYNFKCADYLTILDLNNVNKLFKKRYWGKD